MDSFFAGSFVVDSLPSFLGDSRPKRSRAGKQHRSQRRQMRRTPTQQRLQSHSVTPLVVVYPTALAVGNLHDVFVSAARNSRAWRNAPRPIVRQRTPPALLRRCRRLRAMTRIPRSVNPVSSDCEMPAQISVSTPSSASRLARSSAVVSPRTCSCRATSRPSANSTNSSCPATSKTGEMRPCQIGMAIFMDCLLSKPCAKDRSLQRENRQSTAMQVRYGT